MALAVLSARIAREAEAVPDSFQVADVASRQAAQKRSIEVRKLWSYVQQTWQEIENRKEEKLKSEEAQKRLKEIVERAKSFSNDLLKKLEENQVVEADFDGRNVTSSVTTPVPRKLLHGDLRPYQHVGLHWLAMLHGKNHNGILADEMGLGKTIMTIATLAHLAEEKQVWGPHLIVVPTSLIHNWAQEFKRWLPGFKVILYEGSAKERTVKRRGWTLDNAFNVCIASYTIVCKDIRMFRMLRWHYLILDEAQHIKNFRGQKWNLLLPLATEARLLLTGTPLQNNLMELWSLMHFLMPDIFSSRSDFKEWFGDPLEELIASGATDGAEQQQIVRCLHEILRPFVLRRLKCEVERQLPMKVEKVIRCPLSRRQRLLYDEFLNRREVQKTLGEQKDYLGMMNILMQLRKVCNHPNLFEERRGIQSLVLEAELISFVVPQMCLLTPYHGPFLTPLLSVIHYMCTIVGYGSALQLPLRLPSTKPPPVQYPTFKLRNMQDAYRADHIAQWKNKVAAWEARRHNHQARLTVLQTRGTCIDGLVQCLVPLRTRRLGLSHQPAYVDKVYCYAPQVLVPMQRQEQGVLDGKYGFPLVAPPYQWWLEDSYMGPFLVELRLRRFMTIAGIMKRKLTGNQSGLRAGREFMFDARLDPPPRQYWACPPLSRRRHIQFSLTYPCDEGQVFAPPQEEFILGCPRAPTQVTQSRSIMNDCGKLQTVAMLLAQLEKDRKVLIFTQFTKMLDILEVFLDQRGYTYLRLDGSTKSSERMRMVDRFNADERIFVFLLSTRAGGLGLNLTGASVVIFFDSDWNPAMDRQAMDRVHRIGQTKDVHIIRLVSEHTVEEQIWRKQLEKRKMDDLVVNQGQFTLDKLKSWTAQDVMQILTGVDNDDIYKEEVLHGKFDEFMDLEDEEDKANYQKAKVGLKNDEKTMIEDFGGCDSNQLPPLVKWALERGKSLAHLGAKPQTGLIPPLPKRKRRTRLPTTNPKRQKKSRV